MVEALILSGAIPAYSRPRICKCIRSEVLDRPGWASDRPLVLTIAAVMFQSAVHRSNPPSIYMTPGVPSNY